MNKDCAGAPCLVDSLRDYKVEAVECGDNHTFAIVTERNNNKNSSGDNDNQLIYAWGSNKEG